MVAGHQREGKFNDFFIMKSEVYSSGVVFPKSFQVDSSDDGGFAKITISPLQKGFGVTIGNIFRRTLLSSIRGIAVDTLKIDDAKHEYSTIEGIKQSVPEIIFNLRHIVFSSDLEKATIDVSVKGPKKVYASDIKLPTGIKIVNQNVFLFEITSDRVVNFTITLISGIGDVFVYQSEQQNIDAIELDKHFSPVLNVATSVLPVRVDKQTDYDKLVLEIKTNGSISAEDAFKIANTILINFLTSINECQFKMYNQTVENKATAGINSENGFNYNLLRRIDDLELSVRSLNCLKNDGVEYLGDLVIKNESDMLRTPNFGRKSLNELKQILAQMKLKFGMNIEWPPKDIKALEIEAQEYFDGE